MGDYERLKAKEIQNSNKKIFVSRPFQYDLLSMIKTKKKHWEADAVYSFLVSTCINL